MADHARDVPGEDIHPNSVSIGDTPVINDQGQWVGDPTGLVGAQGERGLKDLKVPREPPVLQVFRVKRVQLVPKVMRVTEVLKELVGFKASKVPWDQPWIYQPIVI